MRALLLATAIVAVAPAAHAQRVNDQYQLRGSTAVTDVTVGSAVDVGATAVASGNAASATSEDTDVDFQNTQHMDGDANAIADVTVWGASGNIAVTTAAVANGATAVSNNGDMDLRSTQWAHGDASAETHFNGGAAGNAGTSASASGNVGAVSVSNGQARMIGEQESTGSVSANVEADHGGIGQAVSGSIASANNVSIGGETATILTDTQQRAYGESVSARTDLYAGYAVDASGNATANANAMTIDNQWGYVNARIDQDATANVRAESYVTLGGDFLGFGSAGAYGVGNQAIVANVGSDTVLDVTQSNAGSVEANAALAGDGGGMALASAAAYGNSVSGSLCAYCDDGNPELNATSSQTNSGDVRASTRIATDRAAIVGATATAIGNAATFQAVGPN